MQRAAASPLPPPSPSPLLTQTCQFLPGQWVDTYCPGIAKAGGFTITSSPSKAAAASSTGGGADRYVELAIKTSPDNPAAAWLWQAPPTILGATLQIRIGGSFVFPPPAAPPSFAQDGAARVVFVAGGIGINPLISMASYLGELHAARSDKERCRGPEVVFLYSVRAEPQPSDRGAGDDECQADRIPFLRRLAALFRQGDLHGELQLYVTGNSESDGALSWNDEKILCVQRRITTADIDAAVLGHNSDRIGRNLENVFVYVCGVPTMTDAFVAHLTGDDGPGLSAHQILCERWW